MFFGNIAFAVIFLAFSLFVEFKAGAVLTKKEKAVYLSVVFIAFLIIVLHSLNIKVPSPSALISDVIDFITKK